jgi:hypothetical protein
MIVRASRSPQIVVKEFVLLPEFAAERHIGS